MVSKGVMVLMVKLIDELSSDERNVSANQRRASQFEKIGCVSDADQVSPVDLTWTYPFPTKILPHKA